MYGIAEGEKKNYNMIQAIYRSRQFSSFRKPCVNDRLRQIFLPAQPDVFFNVSVPMIFCQISSG